MKLPFIEKYKGYTLKCSPQATQDEGFLAFLVITHGAEPVQIDYAAALALPCFATESEAALAALSEAIRWVDDAATLQPARHRSARRSNSAISPVEISSVRIDPTETGVWEEMPPNGAYLHASRRIADRRSPFSDRRQAHLADRLHPSDHPPAAGERRMVLSVG